jgi:hypothetical protein
VRLKDLRPLWAKAAHSGESAGWLTEFVSPAAAGLISSLPDWDLLCGRTRLLASGLPETASPGGKQTIHFRLANLGMHGVLPHSTIRLYDAMLRHGNKKVPTGEQTRSFFGFFLKSRVLTSVNMLRELKLHKSGTSKHSFVLVYRIYFVSNDTILM